MCIYSNNIILMCACVIKLKYNMTVFELLRIQLSLSDGSSSDMLPSPITLRNLITFTFSVIHWFRFGQHSEFNGLSDIFGN